MGIPETASLPRMERCSSASWGRGVILVVALLYCVIRQVQVTWELSSSSSYHDYTAEQVVGSSLLLLGLANHNKTETMYETPSKDHTHQVPNVTHLGGPQYVPHDNNNNHLTTKTKPTIRTRLLIHLSGEFGNIWSQLSAARALALEFSAHSYTVEWVIRNQGRLPVYARKWKPAVAQLQSCFPWLSSWNFSAGNTPYYTQSIQHYRHYLKQPQPEPSQPPKVPPFVGVANAVRDNQTHPQEAWLFPYWHALAYANDHNNATQFDHMVQRLLEDAQRQRQRQREQQEDDDATILLYVNSMINDATHFLYRRHLAQDQLWNAPPACCRLDHPNATTATTRLQPYPNETVFHWRGFAHEIPTRSQADIIYQEASPTIVATRLLAHLSPGSRVALVGPPHPEQRGHRKKTAKLADNRNHNNHAYHLQDYGRALQERGLYVRYISQDHFGDDFCFLWQTCSELVGTSTSTFVRWAGLLGHASPVRLYSLEHDDFIHHNKDGNATTTMIWKTQLHNGRTIQRERVWV